MLNSITVRSITFLTLLFVLCQGCSRQLPNTLSKKEKKQGVKLLRDGKEQYVQVGQGETPLAEAITALVKGGYKGYYSFEWEKRWHPEIEAPEIVIPDYPKAMKRYF